MDRATTKAYLMANGYTYDGPHLKWGVESDHMTNLYYWIGLFDSYISISDPNVDGSIQSTYDHETFQVILDIYVSNTVHYAIARWLIERGCVHNSIAPHIFWIQNKDFEIVLKPDRIEIHAAVYHEDSDATFDVTTVLFNESHLFQEIEKVLPRETVTSYSD